MVTTYRLIDNGHRECVLLFRSGIDEREQKLLLRKVLKPIWLETHHTESVRKYRIRGFGASARQHTFPRFVDGTNNDTEERQSVYDYFLEKYNMKLNHPDLPTVGKSLIEPISVF
jgi:hypothetical protein